MPKIIFNCSTNVVGGGVKNSGLFILESLRTSDSIEWIYAVSSQVKDFLSRYDVIVDGDDRFHVFYASPSRDGASRTRLLALVDDFRPDLIFTMAGPAYVEFPVFHVLGLSSAYITHPDWTIFKFKRSFFSKLKLIGVVLYQFFQSRKADFFVFQTEEARGIFSRNARIPRSRTAVISNAFDSHMVRTLSGLKKRDYEREQNFSIFCPGAAYEHKGFQFIPEIAFELSKITHVPFEFVVTLPPSPILDSINKQIELLGIKSYVRNIGPFDYENIGNLYAESDIVFVPSLLETFSATYLEAMVAKRLLVVSDKGFARDICKSAAFYVNPLDAGKTAEQFASIFLNINAYNAKLELGQEIARGYGNQHQRFRKIIKLLLNLEKGERLK